MVNLLFLCLVLDNRKSLRNSKLNSKTGCEDPSNIQRFPISLYACNMKLSILGMLKEIKSSDLRLIQLGRAFKKLCNRSEFRGRKSLKTIWERLFKFKAFIINLMCLNCFEMSQKSDQFPRHKIYFYSLWPQKFMAHRSLG